MAERTVTTQAELDTALADDQVTTVYIDALDLHRHCIRMSGPPVQPGTYRAHRCRDQWVFTAP